MITASLVLYKTKEEDLRKVLSCVQNSSINTLCVIDNSPTPALQSIVDEYGDKCKYTHGQGNVGYGYAHNLGFKLAQEVCPSDYHVVLNPDIYFEPDVMSNLASFMDKNPQAGMVMPKVFYPSGDFQYLCKLLPSPSDIFMRQFAPKAIRERNNRRYVMMGADYEQIMNIPSLSGCFMFLRSNIFKQIGGFDTRYFMHFEDIDLTRRIGDIAQTVYYPGASIIHAHAAAHKQSKKMLLIGLQSAIKYFNKWGWLFDKTRNQRNREAIQRYCKKESA